MFTPQNNVPKKKINAGFYSQTSSRKIRMQSLFPSNYRDILFTSHSDDSLFYNKKLYIHNPETEKELGQFLSSAQNSLCIFLGHTGMGKSITLANYFRFANHNCQIIGDILLVPIFKWNKMLTISKKFKMHTFLHTVTTFLSNHFGISNTLSPRDHNHESKTEYEIRRLQYLIKQAKLKSIVFILDNIEDIPKEDNTLLKFVELFCRLTEKKSIGEGIPFLTKILISSSPARFVYALERGDFLSVDDTPDFIYLRQWCNTEQLFAKKINTVILPNDTAKAWQAVSSSITKISQKFDRKYDDFIRGITNFNMNDTLAAYADILSNKFWVKAKFSYNNQQELVFNNISVLRALFCLDNEMFCPDIYKGKLCNFLYIDDNMVDNSLILLLIVKRFYNECILRYPHNTQVPAKNYNIYGEIRHLKPIEITRLFKEMFTSNPQEANSLALRAYDCITYLYKNGILAKCPKAYHGESHDLTLESRLYLTPLGRTLWESLAYDSCILEMFREDYPLDIDLNEESESEEGHHSCYSSYVHMKTDDQTTLFRDVCRLISELGQLEKEATEATSERKTFIKYQELFGPESICSHLYQGLNKSVQFSNKHIDQAQLTAYEQLNEYFDTFFQKEK